MKMTKKIYAANRQEWREWLRKNFNKEREVWLVYYKRHTGKPRVIYNDAVEEALCFGWIDSNIQKIDEEKYAQKFTSRYSNSKWSELNIRRMKKLIATGLMTKYGLEKIDPKLLNEKKGTNGKSIKKELPIPEKIINALKINKTAWQNFTMLAPSYRRIYILWLSDAKREETFQKRITEAISLLRQNKKLGMK
jgi:uncharacterized protein YdeI (YjbR/CyaY-like superfamily)